MRMPLASVQYSACIAICAVNLTSHMRCKLYPEHTTCHAHIPTGLSYNSRLDEIQYRCCCTYRLGELHACCADCIACFFRSVPLVACVLMSAYPSLYVYVGLHPLFCLPPACYGLYPPSLYACYGPLQCIKCYRLNPSLFAYCHCKNVTETTPFLLFPTISKHCACWKHNIQNILFAHPEISFACSSKNILYKKNCEKNRH